MFIVRIAIAAQLAFGVLAACGGGKSSTASVRYAVTAEENYQKGLARLEKKDWIAAAKYFNFVKARFAYSKYSVSAKLRLADAEFGAKNYLQAIDAYRSFIKFHPTHETVKNGYCDFRVGESFYKLIPEDFFLIPPSHEMDQGPMSDARSQLGKFVKRHPKSKYAKQATELRIKVDTRLAAHEWYVAKFYWERGKTMATVLRLRRLLTRHSGAGYDGDALWLLGRAYSKAGMGARARKVLERLVREYPTHKHAPKAKTALAKQPA